ncbi:hypothetical protein BBJ29_005560 [Phytophthora kernoviae]|uniref:Intradiol ring-cleavage dioxygenases domain-containing protein n=1 Tax=Phytophthora kernoviae TaxID=325452 RepID=A0A3F2RLI5_9STRA|nr:hypothetical protein BBJ29_005560 [Phytophthora kernoviae]RLN59390.1 hypothetical protein BBP00_00006538 [Phytophthora kernoviae]
MDLQFIDITSCKPVNNLYVDFWHANTSGVYSGVIASTNGNSKDATNVNNTFHRGLSPTDSNGFVSFTTKFPGFYTGRATHIHIMTHYNGTLNKRRYTGGHVSHVGQIFFDQSLLTTVQGTDVYANNKNQATKNADDSIVKQSGASSFDPFVKYVLLGKTVSDGLLSWISVGVDMTQNYNPSAAATYTGDGVSGTTATANTTTNITAGSESSSAAGSGSLQEKALARRLAMFNGHTKHRRLDADTAMAIDHQSSRTGLSSTTLPSELFGSTPACLLEPEATEGPYYVSGELIRSDIRENQPGIDLYMDLQFIDVNTCSPVDNLYVDFWHANTSGVYSGVVARTNGNSDDASNVDTTFHRGLSPTDSDGFVTFTTKFPGLYTGRTTHIHIMTHYDGTVLDNGTYSGGRISHVGQIFFDQDLITDVQSSGIYAANSNRVTTNSDDSILLQSTADSFDPFVEYALLGDAVDDGLLSWITVGVDMTNEQSVSVAGTYTGSGSMATSDNTGTASSMAGSGSQLVSNSSFDATFGSASAIAGNDGVEFKQCDVQVLAFVVVLMYFLFM